MSEPAAPDRSGLAAVAAVVLLAALFGAFDLFDYDLGLARATGRWIVEHRAVPTTNVFSAVNAGHPFVDDKWLFHVLAFAVVDGVGETAAVLLRMALLALLWWTMLRGALREGRGAVAALVGLVALVAASERFWFRPELFSLLFVAAFAVPLLAPRRLHGAEIATLLGLQVLWTNLHGYFVLGPILAAAAAAGAWIDGRMRRAPDSGAGQRLVLVIGLVAASFVNPYGWKLVASPVAILLELRAHAELFRSSIVEFVPPFGDHERLSSDLIAYRVLLALVALAAASSWRTMPVRKALPLLALLLMSLQMRRNMAAFAVVAAPIVADALAPLASGRIARRAIAAAAIAGVALFAFLHVTNQLAVFDRQDKRFAFRRLAEAAPLPAIAFVKANLPADGLFNSFSFGSTFVGEAWPERKPFIDGNTAGYDPAFLQEYVDAVTGKTEPDALVAKWNLRFFLIKPGHPLTGKLLAQRDRYVPLFLDARAVVIAVKDRVDPDLCRRFDLRPKLRSGAFTPIAITPRTTLLQAEYPHAELSRAFIEAALGLREDAERSCEAALRANPGAEEAERLIEALRKS